MKNDKKTKAIATVFIVIMAFIFTGLMGYMFVRSITKSTERSLVAYSQNTEKVSEAIIGYAGYLEETVGLLDDLQKNRTISDVNESEDDVEGHDFGIENLLTNTLELLPTITNQREKVKENKIDISAFPDSYALTTEKKIELPGATVSVPMEVYLYNVGIKKSSEIEVVVRISGDTSVVKSIGWNSSDMSKVTLSKCAGEKVTVSCADPDFTGTVPVILVVSFEQERGKTCTQELSFDVCIEGISYGNNMLTDLDGNVLYLDEAGTQAAYVSDYGNYDYFYGAVKTTGWQYCDNRRYYYDGNSTPVTGHQIIGGIAYDFGEDGILQTKIGEMGIDVSKYQKDIDWELVAASGVSFAIIRCGYRGAVSGKLAEDPYFYKNVEGATKAGVQVGVYFFTQATTVKEAREEALMAIQMCRGYSISLPIYIDSEGVPKGRANNLDKKTRTACLKAFCDTINSAGYEGGVYASKCWYYDQVYAEELESYNIWVAQYNSECNYKGKRDFWQYSSKEHINGIVGYVDCDIREAVY